MKVIKLQQKMDAQADGKDETVEYEEKFYADQLAFSCKFWMHKHIDIARPKLH